MQLCVVFTVNLFEFVESFNLQSMEKVLYGLHASFNKDVPSDLIQVALWQQL